MKWIKKDYLGNEQTWYSQDIIDKIKLYMDSYRQQCEECEDRRCCSSCFYGSAYDLSEEILDIIEE